MNFNEIVDSYRRSGRVIESLETENGCFCCIPEGGRVLALSFSPAGESLFFLNPALGETLSGTADAAELSGGPGGDRIRFAPEYAYAWAGKERDTVHFSNYRQQESEDPGVYSLKKEDNALVLRTSASLLDRLTDRYINFSAERRVCPAESPIALPKGVRFAGYRSDNVIWVRNPEAGCTVGLWFLLQVEAGSTLIVPLKKHAPPLAYFNRGNWTLKDNAMIWPYDSRANAKVGYGTSAVTGRTGVLRKAGADRWVLLVREFPVKDDMYYCDGVSPEEAGDQVFQAWDGFGFGEMEYHSPAAGAPPLPHSVEDTSFLWAFEGEGARISEIIGGLLRSGIEGLIC